MIVYLPQNFRFIFILPKHFTYFSTNPELNFKLQSTGFKTLDYKNFNREKLFESSINFQSKLLELSKNNKYDSLNYISNFNYLKNKNSFHFKQEIEKLTNKKVYFINQYFNHKNFKLLLSSLINKRFHQFIYSYLIILINFPFTFLKLFKILFKKHSIIDASKSVSKNISTKFNIKNYYVISNVLFDKNSISFKPLIFLFSVFCFPLLIFQTFKLISIEKKLIRYNYLRFKNYFDTILLTYFSFVFRKIFTFNFYTLNNLGLSEAMINNGDKKSNHLINHGVHYFDNVKKLNLAWIFHSKTIFNSKNAILYSSNIFDKIFLLKNMYSNDVNFKKPFINYSTESVKVEYSNNNNNILIADTFKDDNYLRPFLYHDALQYIKFLKVIVDSLSNTSNNIIIRHRDDSIISCKYIKKIFKNFSNVVIRSDGKLTDFFKNDPVVISYSSTVIFESLLFNLRTISFDFFNTGINFLNAPNFNKNLPISKRFFYRINSENDLKYLICKI